MKHLLQLLIDLGPDVLIALVMLAVGVPLGLVHLVRMRVALNRWRRA